VEEDEVELLPEEVSIAYVGKNVPFSLFDKNIISDIMKEDYSRVRKVFSPSVSSVV
jgi:hypothetical protein